LVNVRISESKDCALNNRTNAEGAARSKTWKRIWDNKYRAAEGPVHKLDGFDLLTEAEWRRLVERFCRIMAPISGSDILEVGCGAGAFLGNIEGAKSLSGIDYSSSAVELAKANLPGEFVRAEAAAIPFPAKSFDIVFSFGVFFYFDSTAYAKRVLREMVRVARPGGRIFIFDINDARKKAIYEKVRAAERREAVKKTAQKTSHLFFTKKFFRDAARTLNLKVRIADETGLGVSFHTGAQYRFLVEYTLPG
jgi:ubiquinone/menaquinone biosynthesis C-methylase UbiE